MCMQQSRSFSPLLCLSPPQSSPHRMEQGRRDGEVKITLVELTTAGYATVSALKASQQQQLFNLKPKMG